MTENLNFVSFNVHAYNWATRKAMLSKTARTMCAFFVDGRSPISPVAAWLSLIGACKRNVQMSFHKLFTSLFLPLDH